MKYLLHPHGIWILASLASTFATLPSLASEAYPATITSALKLKSVPQCTLCHKTILGGANTVVTKFGRSLVMHGLSGSSNVNSLKKALASEQEDPVDSDGDSVFDLDELREGSNPNVVDREPPPPPPPEPDPVGEGGSSGAAHSGGAGSVPGHDPEPEGGTTSAASGGSSGGRAEGGRATGGARAMEQEPELPEVPEIPVLQTGCSLGAATAPGALSGLFTLSALGLLLRSRRARRPGSHR